MQRTLTDVGCHRSLDTVSPFDQFGSADRFFRILTELRGHASTHFLSDLLQGFIVHCLSL